MTLIKDYTAEDLQNAFDKGRATGRDDMFETIQELKEQVRDLKDQLHVEKLSHKDMANVLNNYEELVHKQRTWVGLTDEEFQDEYRVSVSVDDFRTRLNNKLKEKNT